MNCPRSPRIGVPSPHEPSSSRPRNGSSDAREVRGDDRRTSRRISAGGVSFAALLRRGGAVGGLCKKSVRAFDVSAKHLRRTRASPIEDCLIRFHGLPSPSDRERRGVKATPPSLSPSVDYRLHLASATAPPSSRFPRDHVRPCADKQRQQLVTASSAATRRKNTPSPQRLPGKNVSSACPSFPAGRHRRRLSAVARVVVHERVVVLCLPCVFHSGPSPPLGHFLRAAGM